MMKIINGEYSYKDGEIYKKVYNSYNYGEYILIQFEEGGKYRLYRKEGLELIKFDGRKEFYNCLYYVKYIEIKFERGGKRILYKIDGGEAIKFDGRDEYYASYDYGEYVNYVGIQFEEGGNLRIYRKFGGDAIKFDGKDEYYDSCVYGEYIKIQFEEGGEFKRYDYKDIEKKKISIELTEEQLKKIKHLIG